MIESLRAVLISDPLIVVLTLIMGTISLLTSFFDPTGRRQHEVARAWSRLLLIVSGVKVTVRGLENLEPGQNYVLAANHSSYMDTPIVLSSLPLQFRFLAKQSLFYWPMVGWHLKRAGHIPVVRDDPRASVRSMTDAARIMREKNVSVLLFPEGGRTPDGELQEFKEGAAFVALKAVVPVLPIAIVGARPILPMGSSLVRPGEVELRIGVPIPTAALTLKNRASLTAEVRDNIQRMLESPSAEAEPAKQRT